MGKGDDTPIGNLTQMIERDHFALKSVTVAVQDLTREVRGHTAEAAKLGAELKEHVKSCDRRYAEARDARRGDLPGPAAVHPVVRKLIDKAIDYTIFCVVILIVFAFKHGAQLPMPTP